MIDSLKIPSINQVNIQNSINTNVKIVVVADLHSCNYGSNQNELIEKIKKQNPDIILFAGDIIDEDSYELPEENAYSVLEQCAHICHCFFVTGNHEYYNDLSINNLKEKIIGCGVNVLDGKCTDIYIKSTHLCICGVDDLCSGNDIVKIQLEACAQYIYNKNIDSVYTILISHRPFMIKKYLNYPFDLIVCGHAHGGQWAIPGLINGLYAPDEGLFPLHAGGLYYYENKKRNVCKSKTNQLFGRSVTQKLQAQIMVVSRGLARETTKFPRIGNSPELVVITLY
ncbi:MAG TPA: metallophosphoesterase [Treponemataceae bacterium]|nr:metallophosphoesterase [Treponemataceae bacterium]